MGSQPGRRPLQLGATFTPGGSDDFYMPELISPAPQRVTPEVPEKIQDNLQRLELDATPVNRLSGLQSPSSIPDSFGKMPELPSRASTVSTMSDANPQSPHSHYNPASIPQGASQMNAYNDLVDQPTFSPFPPLRKRSANVPPSDEEKEAMLETSRMKVLNSDDPEMQLSWAQDTLNYVEISSQNETRLSESQAARPQTPHTEHQLRLDALNVVSFLADQHHPKAEFMKGMWLEFGKFGYRMDKKEAYRCYQRSAQKGYARAEYRMGMQFESSNEPDKAIKHYSLGVQAGDSASNYRLGMMTLLGQHGQRLDYQKGVQLISYSAQTADENAPQGAYVFGMLQARELPQIDLPEQYLRLDVFSARYNIEKAAYLGFAKAQTKMGAAYELCQLGCDFDPALSLHYNALAAKQGEPDAEMAISKWFLCGYEGVFEKNEALAFKYAQRAAYNGLATAEFALGYFYEIGIHVAADLNQSRSWYEKAAQHGNKDAAGRIDGISRAKTLSRKDHENVAVKKIQSQYGSQLGKRPERFKNPAAHMPTISDQPIDMPEPQIPKLRPEQQPYAYRNPSGPNGRPVSTAPYPLDDGLGRGRPPANGPASSNQNLPIIPPARPSSAQSETSYGDNNFRGSGYPTFQPSRPGTIGNAPNAGRGRGAPPGPPDNTTGGRGRGEIAYGPPYVPNAQYSRQASAGYASPRPQASPGQSPAMTASRPTSAQPPTIDIGYSAPPDLSGADRQKRQQRIDNHNMPPPGPKSRYSSYDGQVGRNQDRVSSLPQPPHPHTMPAPVRPDSTHSRPNSSGRPPVTLSDRPPRADSALPPPKTPNFDRPAATPPPTVPAAARPPGKGPKTFQEMGVPATKQDGDCIVM